MAGSRNNIQNRGQSLSVFCPQCDSNNKESKLTPTMVAKKGMFYFCPTCDFKDRLIKGAYKKYRHIFL